MYDFKCAANWRLAGTLGSLNVTNPLFQAPCYLDTAVFPQNGPMSAVVPKNSYLASVTSNYAGQLTDTFQLAGAPINFNPNLCPKPFSTETGPMYCELYCVTSCPQLNPDPLAAQKALLAEALLEANYTGDATKINSEIIGNMTVWVDVYGAINFTAPVGTSPSVIQSVSTQANHGLVNIWTSPTFAWMHCDPVATGITCELNATVPKSKLLGFLVGSTDILTQAALNAWFAPTVADWFVNGNNNELQGLVASRLSTGYIANAFYVPSSFTNGLNLPISVSGLTNALATRLNESYDNIFDFYVFPAAAANASYFVFYTLVTNVSSSAATNAADFLAAPVFSVTLANGNVLPLNTSSDPIPKTANLSLLF